MHAAARRMLRMRLRLGRRLLAGEQPGLIALHLPAGAGEHGEGLGARRLPGGALCLGARVEAREDEGAYLLVRQWSRGAVEQLLVARQLGHGRIGRVFLDAGEWRVRAGRLQARRHVRFARWVPLGGWARRARHHRGRPHKQRLAVALGHERLCRAVRRGGRLCAHSGVRRGREQRGRYRGISRRCGRHGRGARGVPGVRRRGARHRVALALARSARGRRGLCKEQVLRRSVALLRPRGEAEHGEEVAVGQSEGEPLKERHDLHLVVDRDAILGAHELDRRVLIQKALAPRVCRLDPVHECGEHGVLEWRERRDIKETCARVAERRRARALLLRRGGLGGDRARVRQRGEGPRGGA